MAKSFKNLISEVAQPKAGEEKAFKDQHQVRLQDAQPTGQDHIFKGTVQQKKRLADVLAGQDAAKYDAAYKNKNTEFSLPRDLDREVKEETQLDENPAEEKPMMMNQLRTMAHNLGGIARYINACDDCEEWFQNKLSGVAKEMQTLYGYATAETMAMGMKEETELEEASCGCGPDCEHCGGDHADSEVGKECDCCGNMIKEATAQDRARYDAADDKKKKPVTLPKAPWDKKNEEVEEDLDEAHPEWHVTFKSGHKPQRVKGRNTPEAIKKAEKRAQNSGEKDSRLKAMYKDIKKVSEEAEQIDEISKELASRYLKRAPARAADAGEKHARAGQAYDKEQGAKDRKKSIRKFLNTQTGVARATNRLMKKEEVELEEKFTIRTSILVLDSGEKVKVSRQDADLLTKFFRQLNPKNSTDMRKVLVKDKQGYEEILGFAREAL